MAIQPETRPTRESAILRARSWILDGKRIDMGGLATDVGVGRVTLHRWFGTREQLIGDTLWSIIERTLNDVGLEAEGRGADRISFIICGAANRFGGSAPITRFVATEPKAFGMIVSPASGMIARYSDHVQRLIEVEMRLQALPEDLDPATAANMIARVSTSLSFADLAAQQQADLPFLDRTVRAFLR